MTVSSLSKRETDIVSKESYSLRLDTPDALVRCEPAFPGGAGGATVVNFGPADPVDRNVGGSKAFWVAKRIFDVGFSCLLFLPFAIAGLVLLAVNPVFNRGPLFYTQIRMGRDCRAFRLVKFRTMVPSEMRRGADDPVETHRITALGRFLRKTRIDELPQILNVFLGHMSLIGPRPDLFSHAKTYRRRIADYRLRHMVRPGISGLAQVNHGYAQGVEETREKARLDILYIENAGFALEAKIFLMTLRTILRQVGM